MSEHHGPPPVARDRGMTLPELMIAVTITGLITTLIVAAITVSLRQVRGTEGRLNVAQAEQMVGLWLPGDLASAATVSTDPAATLCFGEACPVTPTGGSSALLATWEIDGGDSGVVRTSVMYYFAPAANGAGFELIRYACSDPGGSWACDSTVVLRNLSGPPPGTTFVPGATRPDWVIQVSEPLSPEGTDESDVISSTENVKNARRVVVTIHGGGTGDGSGGGTNQISITAGGTRRQVIDGTSMQGAPSLTKVINKCGGPITLLVDESNSIGSAVDKVKQAVTDFIEALAGTPVKLQVIGFHTYSRVLGADGAWHKYWDMTEPAEVEALLDQVSILRGSWPNDAWRNGATNWEEAFFRTFYTAEGTTAPIIPETVVFFTDGVPTQDRLNYRTAPGILPAEPPDPGEPWPDSTGSSFSQVAFNRANFIATWARASVDLIGVGVGEALTSTDLSKVQSNWITMPGAGYHLTWERGSYSYVRETTTYELRYQKRDTSSGPWYWVTKTTYDNTSSTRRRDLGWTPVTLDTYLTVENPPDTSSSDGSRWSVTQTPVSTAEYQANASNPAYKAVEKTWANGPDWEPWTDSRTGIPSSQLRSTKVYSQPYEAYESNQTVKVHNSTILGRIITGSDQFERAIWNAAENRYENVETAQVYLETNFAQLPVALKAIALGECGGSLTLQTRYNGAPASDPFSYQNTRQVDASGHDLAIVPTVQTTNRSSTTVNWVYDIDDGRYHDVLILPTNLSDLGAYDPVGWTCRAGTQPRAFTLVDIPGSESSPWKGIEVRVGANEAVSCTQNVTK